MAIILPNTALAAARAASLAPQKAAALAPKGEPAAQPSVLMARKAQSTLLARIAPQRWTHQEMVQSRFNAELLDSMVAQTRKTMLAAGIDPSDASMVFGVDVIGHEVSKCLACGRIGHDYKPVVVRQLNPAIDMIDEHIAMTAEFARRVGFKNYTIFAVDEQVMPLREFGPPSNDGETVLNRLRAFRERHPNIEKTEVVDGVTEAWMATMLARYNSLDAAVKTTKVNTLTPADRRFISASQTLLSAESGMKGLMYVKGKPSVSLRPFEAQLRAAGIRPVGNAVGSTAAVTAASMFSSTIITPDMHDLKAQLGPAIIRLAHEARDRDGFDAS